MSFISYAQNFEDVMLWRALGHVQTGRYLDIGAQDPVEFSVSLAFYEHGWRGMHVEPNVHYAEKLRLARPDEAVLEVALGETVGIVEFFDIEGTGLSTLQPEIAERHRESGFKVRSRVVPLLPLDEVLERFASEDLHWLKIDVEGAERRVLEGWRKSSVRPWVLVVESTLPLSQRENQDTWESLVLDKDYRFAYFDGLNRFYVAEEHSELLEAFSHPPCVFDDFALVGSQSFCHPLAAKATELEKRAQFLDSENERREAALVDVRQALDETRQALDETRQALDETRQALNETRQALNEAMQQAEKAQASGEHWRLEKNRGEEALAECQQTLESIRQHEVEIRAECDYWRALANTRAAQFEALVHSRSWRLMRPLRGMHRLVRGEYKLTQHAFPSMRDGINHLLRTVLRPLLLPAMRCVLARPGWRCWWSERLRRWPVLHRRLLTVAWHAGLLRRVQLAAAVQPKEQLEDLPSRAQQIYERLQKVREKASKRN